MENGTIIKYMAENGRLNIYQHLFQVAQGLEYLHTRNIIHGDLRGANILIDAEWHARIADFGLAVLADGSVMTRTSNSTGSVRWMAPELHDPESFGFLRFRRTRASDVFAFACTCVEICTIAPPFPDILNDSAVMLKVMKGERPRLPSNSSGRVMPKDLQHVIISSWGQQPSERLDMRAVVMLMKLPYRDGYGGIFLDDCHGHQDNTLTVVR